MEGVRLRGVGYCEVRGGEVKPDITRPPEVRHGGQPVRFRARKTMALLAYLAAEGGRRRRGEIVQLLSLADTTNVYHHAPITLV